MKADPNSRLRTTCFTRKSQAGQGQGDKSKLASPTQRSLYRPLRRGAIATNRLHDEVPVDDVASDECGLVDHAPECLDPFNEGSGTPSKSEVTSEAVSLPSNGKGVNQGRRPTNGIIWPGQVEPSGNGDQESIHELVIEVFQGSLHELLDHEADLSASTTDWAELASPATVENRLLFPASWVALPIDEIIATPAICWVGCRICQFRPNRISR